MALKNPPSRTLISSIPFLSGSLKPDILALESQQRTEKDSVVSTYFLPSDEDERFRLNRQSRYLTNNACDGKLICVPLTLLPGDEILESGTGTGIWLIDLAKDLPATISLTGTDIESRLFPIHGQHPPNISFFSYSVTDLPKSWDNKFKLINQRLLTPALKREQWGSAILELYRVLTPGGWIQLLESGPEIKLDHSGPNMTRIVNSLVSLHNMKGSVHDLQYIIDQRLANAGFVNVQRKTVSLSPRAGLGKRDADSDYDHQTIVFSFLEAAKKGFLATKMFQSEEEFDSVLKGMEKEWDQWALAGRGGLWSWTVAYAQKPDTLPSGDYN
ncbi:S-adenosyl-L-methionine-dependent methyltransferase [Gymnopus androsaceus JB14]|uniref:S-adenosyl-L-methionine-dependent methyltransferase n=1 Tax=Gymnopus androsaceus JB14 TaxID=1447944 RepID=A0A6A4H8D6_9AGAR|nr:S-adenosyl-L-methionine-dependent methyltransferase [Gymnopus androsaceus JB14]